MQYSLVNEDFQNKYIENLLTARGVEDLEKFFYPTPEDLQDPSDLDHIKRGYELLIDKIIEGKKFLLVVDSDTDGFTSAAILYLYLKTVWPHLEIDYTLHENKQHGLEDKIDWLMETEEDYGLIIVPDASTNEYELHERLKAKNLPVLVLDHHIFDGDQFSKNAVIINNQLSPLYKNKELTGAGVVFQFCRYIDQQRDLSHANHFFDLAALGIVGDMASVINQENRYIITKGFSQIRNLFFNSLLTKQEYSTKGRINPMTVAFYIVPLINALIRVGTMEEKEILFRAFVEGEKKIPSQKRGAKGALEYVAIEGVRIAVNAHARQARIRDKAVEKIDFKILKEGLLDNKVLFIRLDDEDDFPPELNGLVAMILAKKYGKPTLVGRLGADGYIKGSIRGLDNSPISSLKDFLEELDLFSYVQGHPQAAGYAIKNDNFSAMHKMANEKLKNIDMGEGIYEVNFTREASDGDLEELIMEIGEQEDIWGKNNPSPLVYIDNIFLTKNDINVIGKNFDTVRFTKNNITYIAFRAEKLIETLAPLTSIKMEVIGKPNINEWNNKKTPQIIIEAYEITDGLLMF